ncbi:MAG: vWA domain-containing protein [Pirellulaceae bacterium]
MIPTTFANPWCLAALVVPVLIATLELVRRRHTLVLPFDHGQQRPGIWLARLLRGVALLPALLLAAAIVLLARPQRPDRPSEERVLTNIEFVLDVSGSMSASFGEGSRFDGSIAAIEAFTTYRRGDSFGLTIFGNEVLHWTPLTKDLEVIRLAAPFLRPENMPSQFSGTEIGKALRASLQRIGQRGAGGGLIVLISDGESADLEEGKASQIGRELAAAGVVLYAIHVGDEEVPRDLYELTTPSGGQVFAARTRGALDSIFGHIDRLELVRLRPTAPRLIDASFLPALIGLSVLGLYQVSLFGLRYTPW